MSNLSPSCGFTPVRVVDRIDGGKRSNHTQRYAGWNGEPARPPKQGEYYLDPWQKGVWRARQNHETPAFIFNLIPEFKDSF